MHPHQPDRAMSDARRLSREADLLIFAARLDALTDRQRQQLRRAAVHARRRARSRVKMVRQPR